MTNLKRLLGMIGLVLGLAAVAQQLLRPAPERDWQGSVGCVPYDLRPPTLSRVRERWWNPDDPRLLTPHVFGVGWSLNLYQLSRRCCARDGEQQAA